MTFVLHYSKYWFNHCWKNCNHKSRFQEFVSKKFFRVCFNEWLLSPALSSPASPTGTNAPVSTVTGWPTPWAAPATRSPTTDRPKFLGRLSTVYSRSEIRCSLPEWRSSFCIIRGPDLTSGNRLSTVISRRIRYDLFDFYLFYLSNL